GDKSLLVERLGSLHDAIRGDVKVLRTLLLELDGGERKRFEFTGWLLDDFCDAGFFGIEALFKKKSNSHTVEKAVSSPRKDYRGIFTDMGHFDRPEAFGDEAGDFVVTVDDEAEARELAGTIRDDLLVVDTGKRAEPEGLEAG